MRLRSAELQQMKILNLTVNRGDQWEIPSDSVSLEKLVGKGAIGEVWEGLVKDFKGKPGSTTVAIKKPKCKLVRF